MRKLKEIDLNNSFIETLPADQSSANTVRQVFEAGYSFVKPETPELPKLIHVSDDMLNELEINDQDSEEFLNIVTGKDLINNSKPFAMCYGGHQFGHWAGQLGDGRAINLAEVKLKNQRWTLQLKGAGRTPYSRTADGLAVLRSSIREYLCSEAMYHLGVSTTRALSIALSGKAVLRDVLYDGNPAYEKGAIVCRVANSFIRFGNFEIFAARKDLVNLKRLTDYTITAFYPELGKPSKQTYLKFFESVVQKTKDMILHWQRVGYVHGVMNTDNMSILGQTIDYGPYGWLEDYDPGWTPNTTDSQHKRYRFGNQPSVGLWNLTQLANALFPLIKDADALTQILSNFKIDFKQNYIKMMKSKIGLNLENEQDEALIGRLTENLRQSEVDMTIFFRTLSRFNGDIDIYLDVIKQASYLDSVDFESKVDIWTDWLTRYRIRLTQETDEPNERVSKMNLVNPKYVLRNYMAQLAIDEAKTGKYTILNELFILLKKPYAEQSEFEKWFNKRPEWAKERVGCSMLSCSS